MNAIKLNTKEKWKHVLTWLMIIIFLRVIAPIPGSIYAIVFGGGAIILSYVLVYYILSLFIFPVFGNKKLYLALFVLLLFSIYCFTDYLIYYHFIFSLGGSTYFTEEVPIYESLIMSALIFFIVGYASFTFYQNKLQVQTITALYENEKVLLNKHLNYLKGQFNTHLTFNFLNYCYQKTYVVSESVADNIETYADLLRYSLQGHSTNFRQLSDEIEHVKNYISIQKVLSQNVYVHLTEPGLQPEILVLPHLFMPVIEMAFTYGVFNNKDHPIAIKFEIINENSMEFKTVFLKRETLTKEIISKKLSHVNQALQLFYPKKHKVVQESGNEYFTYNLHIKN